MRSRYRPGASWSGQPGKTLPRGLGLGLTAALFAATGAYGMAIGDGWQNSSFGSPADAVANLAGFRVNTVQIAGQRELTDEQLFAASGVSGRRSLLFFDCELAREDLEKLPLIKSAQVRKLYPDTLAVTVTERVPYALWQLNGKVAVLSDDGVVLDHAVPERFASLPLVVGVGADKHVRDIVTLLGTEPQISKRVRAATLVAERRWNLTMDNGIVVRLPEANPAAALARLVQIQKEADVLSKDVLAIDLRLEDRMAFRLSTEAASARRDMIAKAERKKGGRA